jgi:GNAT superfamily N-acetyltransferase
LSPQHRVARHDVPGFRLARLATDLKLQGQALGGRLLAAAARRCLRVAAEVGGVILIIDAKSGRAAAWYASYGAVPLADKPLTLVMALATFEADLKAGGHL